MLGNVIEATIMTGRWPRKDVFIPRIPFIPTDYPFEFRRLRFPVKLGYALTINKAQGQTFQTTGLFLDPGCFSHGQFYVGASRVGNPKNLFTARPKAQRCQVTPYVVNVLVVVVLVGGGAIAKYKFVSLLKPS